MTLKDFYLLTPYQQAHILKKISSIISKQIDQGVGISLAKRNVWKLTKYQRPVIDYCIRNNHSLKLKIRERKIKNQYGLSTSSARGIYL